jgi:hypothetical protein
MPKNSTLPMLHMPTWQVSFILVIAQMVFKLSKLKTLTGHPMSKNSFFFFYKTFAPQKNTTQFSS